MIMSEAFIQTINLTGKHEGETISIAWVTVNGMLFHNVEFAGNARDSEYLAARSLNKDLPVSVKPIKIPSILLSKAKALQYVDRFGKEK